MTTCPNCGHKISETDDICPNCGFNLKNIETTFSQISTKKQSLKNQMKAKRLSARAAYREEFIPEKQNTTVQKNDCVG